MLRRILSLVIVVPREEYPSYNSSDKTYFAYNKGIIFLSEDESSASKMKNLARRIEHLFKRL